MGTAVFFAFASTRRRMYAGPLGSHIDEFIALLQDQGYARHSIRCKVRVVSDFSRWLDKHDLGFEDLGAERVNRYLLYRKRAGRWDFGDTSALRQMMDLISTRYLTPLSTSSVALSERERVQEDFRNYLAQHRGLSSATLECYQLWVSRFLRERFVDGPVRFDQLTCGDINGFIQRYARGYSQSRAQQVVTALRAFLRHLLRCRRIAIDLAAGVPSPARWSLSNLPSFLAADQVDRVLDRCDRRTAIGRRDFAMLLLLARLGLRAGEVAALGLDEINWEQGSLTIRGKGGRWTQMPLPHDVGEAIVDYLANGRPSSTDRHVFVRTYAPRRGFRGGSQISIIASRALTRAGIDHPRAGAHIFRHALASEMLRHEASLSEIGDLLRHQHPDTTRIYAKVDLSALRELAMPWPGGVR
jgi:integrase/recombinase XerD